MSNPKQRRLVGFSYALLFTAGVCVVGQSSLAYFMDQRSDSILLGTWVFSLILLTAIILSYFNSSRARKSVPDQTGIVHPAGLVEHWSLLLDAMNHGIVVIDRQFVITYANRSFYNLITDDSTHLIGKPISEVFLQAHPGQPTPISYRLARLAYDSTTLQSTSFDLPDENNRFCHLQISATPITDEQGAIQGILLVYQDRTAERELQETARRHDHLETVSQMAASIAHEVRNPMTSVQGFLQLMSKEIDPAHAHSMYLHVMEEDLKRINSIITEYLNFSRMGSDSLEDVWIGTLLHNTYTLLQSEANLKGIQIVLSLLGNNPLLIANPNRLKQVLINLARNAMEAMSATGGVLTLSLETADDHICLMVKDSGPGIPADVFPQIFQPFYTTKPTGTGLGLFISKQIIEEHSGTIEVESAPEIGTTFRIRLPKNRLFENQ